MRLAFESQEVTDDEWPLDVPARDPPSPDHEVTLDEAEDNAEDDDNADNAEDDEPEQRTPIVGMNLNEEPAYAEVRTSSGRKTKPPSKVSPTCVFDGFS